MANESWKPIPGFPRYEISNLGRVRALAHVRTRKHPRSGRVIPFHYAERIIGSQRPLSGGYVFANLNNGTQIAVHRLVLLAFVGPCPAGYEACHGNGIRDDNRLENLRWDTPESNYADRDRHGRLPRGETHPTAKYSDEVVRKVRRGEITSAQAREQYGMGKSQYHRIRKGQARKDIP